jgi:hypothetical protein
LRPCRREQGEMADSRISAQYLGSWWQICFSSRPVGGLGIGLGWVGLYLGANTPVAICSHSNYIHRGRSDEVGKSALGAETLHGERPRRQQKRYAPLGVGAI